MMKQALVGHVPMLKVTHPLDNFFDGAPLHFGINQIKQLKPQHKVFTEAGDEHLKIAQKRKEMIAKEIGDSDDPLIREIFKDQL